MENLIYKNRVEAGRVLSEKLKHYGRRSDVLILGLPRGGLPVAAEIAEALEADLDVIVVRKLGVPGHEEIAMGAIATGGVEVINMDVMQQIGVPDSAIKRVRYDELIELNRREKRYRGNRQPYKLHNKIVILVDDGIATGATMKAAVKTLRKLNPARIVVAVPVSPIDAINSLQNLADEVICPETPPYFRSVSEWYDNFAQTSDAEVQEILSRSWNAEKRFVA